MAEKDKKYPPWVSAFLKTPAAARLINSSSVTEKQLMEEMEKFRKSWTGSDAIDTLLAECLKTLNEDTPCAKPSTVSAM